MEAVVRRRIRVLAPLAALAGATLLTSCAAGQSAQTAYEKPTLDGTYTDIGKIALRGLSIAAPTSGNSYAPGSSAQVRVVVVNTGTNADRLTSISGSAIGSWSAYTSKTGAAQIQNPGSSITSGPATASKSVPVPAGVRVSFGTPDATKSLLLFNFAQHVYPGTTVRLTFTFANAGSKTVPVPVSLTSAPNDSVVPEPSGSGPQG